MIINNRLTIWLARRLTKRAQKIIFRRQPDFLVGGAENPYLQRWWLIPRNPVFNIYLHQFLRDDDDRALHDHPWPSVSLSLGSLPLGEIYRTKDETDVTRIIHPSSLVFRSASFAHRLVVPIPGALTIFITGPRIREWGFLCPKGWRRWQEFTAAEDAGSTGRGCE